MIKLQCDMLAQVKAVDAGLHACIPLSHTCTSFVLLYMYSVVNLISFSVSVVVIN